MRKSYSVCINCEYKLKCIPIFETCSTSLEDGVIRYIGGIQPLETAFMFLYQLFVCSYLLFCIKCGIFTCHAYNAVEAHE